MVIGKFWLGQKCRSEETYLMFPHTIYSGGQTGVDRAALDAALELGIPIGGYLPRERKDENGDVLPEDKYANMQEMDIDNMNVADRIDALSRFHRFHRAWNRLQPSR